MPNQILNQKQVGRKFYPLVFMFLCCMSNAQSRKYEFCISATPNISWAKALYKESTYQMKPGVGCGIGVAVLRRLNNKYYLGVNMEYLFKRFRVVTYPNSYKTIHIFSNRPHSTFQFLVGRKIHINNWCSLRLEMGVSINTFPVKYFGQFVTKSNIVSLTELGKTEKCVLLKVGYASKKNPRFSFYAMLSLGITKTKFVEVIDLVASKRIQRLDYRGNSLGVNILYRISK